MGREGERGGKGREGEECAWRERVSTSGIDGREAMWNHRRCAWGKEGARHTFYRWIILIHKVTLDELNGEAAFAHSAATHYYELVLP